MVIFKKIAYYSAFIVPLLSILGFYGGGIWNFSCIIFIYLLIPLFDWIIGLNTTNPTETETTELQDDNFYQFVTSLWAYFQVAFLFWATFAWVNGGLVFYEKIGFLYGVISVTGGIGITVAHELGHKQNKYEQFLSRLILMTVSYIHFFIEHNKGHHVWVATPKDPATSRKGETVYAFFFRSVIGSFKSAWHIETERLRRKNIPVWSPQNEMMGAVLWPIFFCSILLFSVSYFSGYWVWSVIPFFFLQSVLAFSLLEMVNYIEHYGIMRKEIGEGRYERVNPLHSWNSSFLVSNFLLFQLQRHSDHHANATRRYQVLRHIDESPQMPQGYPAMLIMSLFPPIWFKVMDKRLENWQKSQNIA